MNLLQFFFIISGVIILILAIDIAKKQRFNALHFLVFIGVGGGLLYFSFFPGILNSIGLVFGLARGADVLVYTSIIFLLYFVLLLLSKHVENKENITSIIREFAIQNSHKKEILGKEVFLIRSYNEEKVVGNVIDSILAAGYKNILIIDDGSTDNSNKVFDKYKKDIYYVRHCKNLGGGAALETGFEYIRRYGNIKYIVTFDADGQHNIKDLPKFYNKFDKNNDLGIVIGSRFIKKTKSNVPFFRKLILSLGRYFTYIVSGVYLTDTHNGYRVLKKETVNKIKLTIDTMAYASELIEEVKKHNIKFKEVPVDILYNEYSLGKGQKSSNAIGIAFRFIWNKFFR